MNLTIKNVPPEEWTLAIRTARHLVMDPEKKDIILSFENGITLWAKRTKAGTILVKGPMVYGD